MNIKFNVCMIATLLLFAGIISVAEKQKTGSEITCKSDTKNELFNHSYFVFGKLVERDSFTTPPDCEDIIGSFSMGNYFTGVARMLIRSESLPYNHSFAQSPYYLLGTPIPMLPGDSYHYSDWFIPGDQNLIVLATGFGAFNIIVREYP